MADYVKSLKVLQRIRGLAGGELKLPQMCVVGDQSSGKSSVLERLTGIEFPVKAGICTKAAIVVECRRDLALSADMYEVACTGGGPGGDDAIETECADEGAGGAGAPPSAKRRRRSPSNPTHRGPRYEECPAAQVAERISSTQGQALADCGKKISDKEVLVRVTGPEQMDIIVIDLPGIINQGDGVEETRALIDRYISQDETLILLVSEAKQDDELVTAMGLAQKYDPLGMRTKRVLTKFDSFDTEEAKKRAAALVNAVCGDSGGAGSRMGAHALICRPDGKKECDPAAERAALEGLGLPRERCGVQSLKETLPAIYAALVRTNLPRLRAAVESRRGAASAALEKIGAEPLDGQVMIDSCQKALVSRMGVVDEELSKRILRFQEKVYETKERLTRQWAESKLGANVFECSLFQGNGALRACMADVAGWWRPLMEELIEGVQGDIGANVEGAMQDSLCRAPQRLQSVILSQWRAHCAAESGRFAAKCSATLDREVDFGTVNHYFTMKFASERAFPDDLVEAFLNSITEDDYRYPQQGVFGANLQTRGKDVVQANIRKKLLDQRAVFEKNFESKTLHEQQQQRLFDAAKALWAVEYKTFVDVIVKDVRAGPRRTLHDWVQRDMLICPKIRENAVEDVETEKARQSQKELLRRMDGSMRELDTLT